MLCSVMASGWMIPGSAAVNAATSLSSAFHLPCFYICLKSVMEWEVEHGAVSGGSGTVPATDRSVC